MRNYDKIVDGFMKKIGETDGEIESYKRVIRNSPSINHGNMKLSIYLDIVNKAVEEKNILLLALLTARGIYVESNTKLNKNIVFEMPSDAEVEETLEKIKKYGVACIDIINTKNYFTEVRRVKRVGIDDDIYTIVNNCLPPHMKSVCNTLLGNEMTYMMMDMDIFG